MAVGYVLINVKPGSEMPVYNIVKELEMVEDATLLFGDYDLIVKMMNIYDESSDKKIINIYR